MRTPLILLAGLAALTSVSHGAMAITEFMYSGVSGEFIEFTNTGSTVVDMSTYHFDDSNAGDNPVTSLAAFGTVQPGESVLLTDVDAELFRTAWGLAPSVKIIGLNVNNLGRGDTINLYDTALATTPVAVLAFGDQDFPGTIRTQNKSGITAPANYGVNNVALWSLSVVGGDHVITSTGGDIGSPGYAAVPEPAALALTGLAALGFLRRRRA